MALDMVWERQAGIAVPGLFFFPCLVNVEFPAKKMVYSKYQNAVCLKLTGFGRERFCRGDENGRFWVPQ